MAKEDGRLEGDPSFPDRLQQLMDARGVTRADLARMVYGTFTDERGYTVAKNRQSIGRYLAGQTMPLKQTARKMADALSVSYTELFPNSNPLERPGSGVKMTPSTKGELAHLEVSLDVPFDTAMEVVRLVAPHAR